ncbi:MAG: response regulator transcription factor [Planctomycetes bacterium]|nr:response regulator transcription factor [Planctomycetota bacterium]
MTAGERPRLLLIEDQRKLAAAVADGLRSDGFEVAVAHSGSDGFRLASDGTFDAVVLDWMLPGRDGLDLLRELRRTGRALPVLMLTARDDVDDRVAGLDAGADDYLVKPFAIAELSARLRSLLRRSRGETASVLRCADLEVDPATHRASRGGCELHLTQREFELLELLLRHQGRLVSRETLARDVWQETSRATSLDNVIDVTIARLRRKVDGEEGPRLLHTVRGVGFIVREEAR